MTDQFLYQQLNICIAHFKQTRPFHMFLTTSGVVVVYVMGYLMFTTYPYAILNKRVFSTIMKDSVVPCVLTDTGKLFQMWGPVDANEDDIDSSFLQNLGAMLVTNDSHNLLELCLFWIRSLKILWSLLHLHLKTSSAILYLICCLIFSQWNFFISLLTSYFPKFATALHAILCTLCSLLTWYQALPMRAELQ